MDNNKEVVIEEDVAEVEVIIEVEVSQEEGVEEIIHQIDPQQLQPFNQVIMTKSHNRNMTTQQEPATVVENKAI
jgi:hypothetical protein